MEEVELPCLFSPIKAGKGLRDMSTWKGHWGSRLKNLGAGGVPKMLQVVRINFLGRYNQMRIRMDCAPKGKEGKWGRDIPPVGTHGKRNFLLIRRGEDGVQGGICS